MSSSRSASRSRATAAEQRRIQNKAGVRKPSAAKKAAKKSAAKPAPVQAGPRRQPANPLPKQHLRKPGLEAELSPSPRFDAPDYRGSGKLEGRVALITGGDSGIGRAVAVLFAREGADVAIAYLCEDADADATASSVEREGRRCLRLRGDVTEMSFCEDAVQRTLDAFGRLDVLVNNAAFQQHAESIEALSLEHFDLTVRTNLYGYFQMAKAALPHLPKGGSIINTGSVTGIAGSGQLLDYSATKGAIHALTKSLASNVIDRGIRVNAVAPGPVWTPLNPADRPAEKVATFGQDTDMHRPAQPEEIAPAYVFLAAPVCSSYITGIVLPITGSVG